MEKTVKALVTVIAILLVAVAAEAFVIAQLNYQRRISATVTIKTVGVGVYADAQCTLPVTSINWGIVEPGSTNPKPVYIRNEANVNAVLSMNTSAWNPPEAMSYITLTWNYTGVELSPNEVVPISFILNVASTISGITTFSFDITVTITG